MRVVRLYGDGLRLQEVELAVPRKGEVLDDASLAPIKGHLTFRLLGNQRVRWSLATVKSSGEVSATAPRLPSARDHGVPPVSHVHPTSRRYNRCLASTS